jgi:hypothetical protein
MEPVLVFREFVDEFGCLVRHWALAKEYDLVPLQDGSRQILQAGISSHFER